MSMSHVQWSLFGSVDVWNKLSEAQVEELSQYVFHQFLRTHGESFLFEKVQKAWYNAHFRLQ